ncbi:MAG: glycosyl hydrolase family 18 protein, partial [Herbinix sp.]|nr:glycosyl hydrolase family 18 protein [Herbinix sp.]
TVFNYQVTKDGELVDIDDDEIVQLAKAYGVAPMMLISTLNNKGVGDPQASNNVLYNMEIQQNLFKKVLNKLKEKGYYGLNIYSQFLTEENRPFVESFITNFSKLLHEEGFHVIVTVSPITDIERTQVTLKKVDYTIIGQNVDGILFLSYEWGFSYGPPASVTSVNLQKEVLDYAVTIVPSEKLLLGFSIIGYDWPLPYIPGESRANAITTEGAIQIASTEGVPIKYNDVSQAPYYFYVWEGQDLHIVWFNDARSVNAILDLVYNYKLKGTSIWNIMFYFTQMWFIINTQYEIERVENLQPVS